MRLRVNMKLQGGHVHCTFWTCEHGGDTFANAGTVIVGEVDGKAFQRLLMLGAQQYGSLYGASSSHSGDIDSENGRTINLDTRMVEK